MDKEGEEGSEDDNIDNFTISHDVCRRNKRSGRNVDDPRRQVQAKVQCDPTSIAAPVQHDKDVGRRWGHGKTPSKGGTPQKANRGTRRDDLGFQLRQCASQLCTTSIRCPNQHSRSPGRRHVLDYYQQVIGRISEVSYHQARREKDGNACRSTQGRKVEEWAEPIVITQIRWQLQSLQQAWSQGEPVLDQTPGIKAREGQEGREDGETQICVDGNEPKAAVGSSHLVY